MTNYSKALQWKSVFVKNPTSKEKRETLFLLNASWTFLSSENPKRNFMHTCSYKVKFLTYLNSNNQSEWKLSKVTLSFCFCTRCLHPYIDTWKIFIVVTIDMWNVNRFITKIRSKYHHCNYNSYNIQLVQYLIEIWRKVTKGKNI